VDDFLGWFGWEDDPESGLIVAWGTGSTWDLSPGVGNRIIARETDSDDILDLAVDQIGAGAEKVATEAGETGAAVVRGAFGITPLTLAILAGGAYLIFQKQTKK
jgi:hypothetical protein